MVETLTYEMEAPPLDHATVVVDDVVDGFSRVLADLRVREDHGEILLNLRHVSGISSAELGLLVATRLRLEAEGCRLRLIEVQPAVVDILVVTKLAKALAFEPACHND